MIFAAWGSGQVLWSLLWLSLIVIWMYLAILVFADVFCSTDLSGWGKALWVLLVLAFPIGGVLVYLVARGGGIPERRLNCGNRGPTIAV